MRSFRVFIYADGLVLPLVVPLRCFEDNLAVQIQRIFAEDLIASRAEVWDGAVRLMTIDAAAIETMRPPIHSVPDERRSWC